MALYALDGTWNRRNALVTKKTNVWWLKIAHQSHVDNDPEAFYRPGVGTKWGVLGWLVGGALGAGARRRTREAYDALCIAYDRLLRPDPHDPVRVEDLTIDIVGYSRGAATAVHLANVIHRHGIRRPRRFGLRRLWRLREHGLGWTIGRNWAPLSAGERRQMVDAIAALVATSADPRAEEWLTPTERDGKLIPPIRFLGIFDTVGSFTFPLDLRVVDFQRWTFGMDLMAPANVVTCVHAMSIDERRRTFRNHRVAPEAYRRLNAVLEGRSLAATLSVLVLTLAAAVIGLTPWLWGSAGWLWYLAAFAFGMAVLHAIAFTATADPSWSRQAPRLVRVFLSVVRRVVADDSRPRQFVWLLVAFFPLAVAVAVLSELAWFWPFLALAALAALLASSYVPPDPDAMAGDDRVTEVWFRGVHSDVGGGSRQPGLQGIALSWMAERASDAGVKLDLDRIRPPTRRELMASSGNFDGWLARQQRVVLDGDLAHATAVTEPVPWEGDASWLEEPRFWGRVFRSKKRPTPPYYFEVSDELVEEGAPGLFQDRPPLTKVRGEAPRGQRPPAQ